MLDARQCCSKYGVDYLKELTKQCDKCYDSGERVL